MQTYIPLRRVIEERAETIKANRKQKEALDKVERRLQLKKAKA